MKKTVWLTLILLVLTAFAATASADPSPIGDALASWPAAVWSWIESLWGSLTATWSSDSAAAPPPATETDPTPDFGPRVIPNG